jgi:segregation and condensation protein B
LDEKNIVEAALFAAGGPVTDVQLKTATNRSSTFISSIIDKLIEEYRERNSPLEIMRLEGKYVMQLKSGYSERVRAVSPRELSPSVLRTLSIVAYYQPIQQADLVKIRGQATYEHIAALEERGLISKTKSGRSFELTTTDAFCDYFGLTRGDIDSIKNQIMQRAKLKKQSLTSWLDAGVPDNDGFKTVRLLVPPTDKGTKQ